jgi:RimJ/RimL family protein N-acetyltransferase
VLYTLRVTERLRDGREATVRFKTPADLKEWRRFVALVPDDSGHAPGSELDLADLSTDYHRFDEPYLVVEVEGEIVGALFIVPHDATMGYHREHVLEFHMDVLPGWRRQGVGSTLVGNLIKWASARGDIHKLEAPVLGWNEAMTGMLSSLGFREEGRADRAWMVRNGQGDVSYDDIIYMGKWISPDD